MMYGIGPRIAAGLAVAATVRPAEAQPPHPPPGATGPQIAETVNAACNCAAWAVATDQPEDVDTDRLRVLVESGVPHWEACWAIWRGTT